MESISKTFYCHCLNISIHLKTPIELKLLEKQSNKNHPFFLMPLIEISNNLFDSQIEHKSIILSLEIEDWILQKCTNCNCFAYAINNKSNKTLLNATLQQNKNDIKKLFDSKDFSPLYKIIIKPSSVNDLVFNNDKFSPVTKDILQEISDSCQNFLVKEQQRSDERIREFQHQEHIRMESLKRQIYKERNVLKYLVTSICKKENPNSQFSPKSETKNVNLITETNIPKVSNKKYPHADGDFFDFDVTEEIADNDKADSIDDFQTSIRNYQDKSPVENISTSMPIRISSNAQRPVSMTKLENTNEDDDDIPRDIAASIKELARSVHNDSSDVFGGRPRQRIKADTISRVQ